MKKGERRKGFTIIEVMLVLAVAGMIFLMVFIALPMLQRQARDTERREDMTKLISAIKKYQSNNRGALPTGTGSVSYNASATKSTWAGFYRDYLGKDFADPEGGNYKLNIAQCGSNAGAECAATKNGGSLNVSEQEFPNGYKISVVTSATCDGEMAVGSANPRKVAVLYRFERVGSYCGNT